MIADAEAILRICGIDRYLHIGCGESTLVFELLKRSIDAYGLDPSIDIIANNLERAPERFFHGSMASFPFQAGSFGTVIIGAECFSYRNEDLLTVFRALQRITTNNLVLYFPPETLRQHAHRADILNRIFWEKLAMLTGFRRHPRSMLVVPYEELEDERLGRLIFLERVPDSANERFSMQWLLQNRDLHMDMLRESGRRADAHLSRYALAAAKIRPGDVVLDAACGLGYGVAILSACSPGSKFIGVDIDPESVAYANLNYAGNKSAISFQTCDVTRLTFLPDQSVDTVISFETIEHLPDYDLFLAEVSRVLKPDGRFLGSVSNMWCDESGKDPNPNHFHVFDWRKLNETVSKYFIVDERWSQNAGGGFRLRESRRSMRSIPLTQAAPDCEWWLISACANPLKAKELPYVNPFQKYAGTPPELVRFEKYYDNPWLYRVIVQLGERLSDRSVLTEFAAKVAGESRTGSADQGAALCVLCYQLLESGHVTYKDVAALVSIINAYEQAYDRDNIHAFRWAVSLHYVGARLLLALGKRQEAMAAFLACAEMDVMKFSPLLATKTISARMYAGLLCLSADNPEEAKLQLRLGIREAHRVLQGDWSAILGDLDHPLPFGLQEAAEVLDIASQCSQTLHAIEKAGCSPGYIWDKVNLKRFGLVEWNKSLQRENDMLRKQQEVMHRQPA